MMCQTMGLPPIGTIGLGRVSDTSRRRVPRPPQRISAFIGVSSFRSDCQDAAESIGFFGARSVAAKARRCNALEAVKSSCAAEGDIGRTLARTRFREGRPVRAFDIG